MNEIITPEIFKEHYAIEDGILYQKSMIKEFPQPTYDINYVKIYQEYGEKLSVLSNIRLANIMASLSTSFKKCFRFLDFGYGNGDFLRLLAKTKFQEVKLLYGYDITGYKPDDFLYVNLKNEKQVFQNTYDIVTFYDSLEHLSIAHLHFVLDGIKSNTRFIIISVPEFELIAGSIYKSVADINSPEFYDKIKKWKHFRPNEHLCHFSIGSLLQLFQSKGYNMLSYNYNEQIVRGFDSNIVTCIFVKSSFYDN
jgi:hypothetical protein